ncbi:MAG: ABC transporter substrate-binding protein [Acidimicrobiales bacterium]
MRLTRSKVAACLFTGALVVAGCGSSDDDTATTTGESTGGTGASPGTGAASGDCTLDEPLKIGFMMDTGLGAIGDVPANAGAEFKVKQINDAGGVGGKPIEYESKQVADDDPAAGQRATAELIEGGADVILGPPFATMGLPMLEETKGEVPVIFVTSTEVALTDSANGSFLASFNDKVQASAAAELAKKQGATNAVTISSNDIPYLNVTTKAFTEVFEAQGGTVQTDLSYSLGATDFSAQVNQIKGLSPVPDVIYSAFFLPEAGVFLEQLRAAGIDSTVIGADGFDASEVWSIGDAAEGVYYTAHTFPAEGNGVQAFLDAYNADGGKDIPTPSFGSLGAEAVETAVAATEAACTTDGKALIEAISTIKDLETTTGTVTYDGTTGTPKRDVVLMTVTDGEPTLADQFFPTQVAK